jgi:hypothetical protein
MLSLGGLYVKHAVQRGIWVPTQHLLWDQGKPTMIELDGRRTGIKYASPDTSPYLWFFFFFFFSLFFENIYKLFLQKNSSAYNLDKYQTVYNTCGRNECIYS